MKERPVTTEELTEELLEKLEEVNYKEPTIAQYRKLFDDLNQYASLKGIEAYNLGFSRAYLLDAYGVDTTIKIDKAALPSKTQFAINKIRILDDYYLHGVILSHSNGRIKKEDMMPDELRELLFGYVTDCERSEQSAYGIKSRKNQVRLFLEYLDANGRGQVSKIDALAVSNYIKTLLPRHEKSIATSLGSLRSFLRWLYRDGKINTDLSLSVPKANRYNYPNIPSVWEGDDVVCLLGSIDRANPVGKRDYAVLSLAARLGMRTVDIRYLRLQNLDFIIQKISFAQHKTGNVVTFPMIDEIGWALADWLRNGRAKSCPHDYVFASSHPPFGQLGDLSSRITRYARAAGITIDDQKHHGMHSLRHTLASTLLEQGVALPLISDVLGHMDPKSTSIYLHCDIEGLRACAIDPDKEGFDE